MKAKIVTLSFFSAACLGASAVVVAQESMPTEASGYVGRVDPDAFPDSPFEHRNRGVTVHPADVRLITPGVDKFSIYPLLGPPHFDEGIARRWNYILYFPDSPGSTQRVRCRMEIRFERPPGRYHVAVSEVVWKDQACADLVAAAN